MRYVDRVTIVNKVNCTRLLGYVVDDYIYTHRFNRYIAIKKTSLNDKLQVIETTLYLVTDENETIAKALVERYIDSMSMSGNKFEII
jgi:hypothetical protein